MGNDDRFEVLRRALAPDRYSDATIRVLADNACELEYPTGATLVVDGAATTESWLVLSGRIEICWRSGLRSVAEAGELIDPSHGNEATRSVITAEVLDSAAVLAIPRTQPHGP